MSSYDDDLKYMDSFPMSRRDFMLDMIRRRLFGGHDALCRCRQHGGAR